MQHVQLICATVILTLALALTSFAGEMDTPGVTSTSGQPSTAVDALTEIALGLLQSLMLF